MATQPFRAAREETDHLAWTQQRLQELGDRPSWLNPLWYAGALGLGMAAGALGDRWNLAFLAETEHQVEEHQVWLALARQNELFMFLRIRLAPIVYGMSLLAWLSAAMVSLSSIIAEPPS